MSTKTVSYVILGAGGHTRVLMDCLDEMGFPRPVGIIDRDASRWGSDHEGVEILGGDQLLKELPGRGVTGFIVGVGSVGPDTRRHEIYGRCVDSGLAPLPVIHPAAILSKRANVGDGVQLLARAIVNAGARLGNNVLINSGAIVEHDCVIEDHAHVATGAVLASGVHIGSRVHVGAGASVRHGIRIGAGATVGLGAAVVKDVPAGAVVGGVPARPLGSR